MIDFSFGYPWEPRSALCVHVICRAPEPDHADADEAVHEADQCVLKVAAKSQALHFAHYNFVRIHGGLLVTPAMAAGLASRVWPLAELIAV